jgi:hypothetical protein
METATLTLSYLDGAAYDDTRDFIGSQDIFVIYAELLPGGVPFKS